MGYKIDIKHNEFLTKAYDQISAMAKASDSHELAAAYGVACGYIECLFDYKVLPKAAFTNLMDQAREAHKSLALRNSWVVDTGLSLPINNYGK